MPTSNYRQLNEIMTLISVTNPESLLDIGVGFGKYGVLSREYLEFWDGRQKYGDWRRRIDGIEAFEDYITPLQRYVYDHLFIGDARELICTLESTYDLALIIGTLEHFTYEDGMALLHSCLQRCRNIVISTPKEVALREGIFGNPYEAHVFQWCRRHFQELRMPFFTVPNADSIIVFVGDDAAYVRRTYARLLLTQRVKKYAPFMKTLYRFVRMRAPSSAVGE